MNARRLLLDALDARWRDFRAARKACRRKLSAEAVHDLRVAARRLLALAELLKTSAPKVPAKPMRRLLKAWLRAFDALRDTQVVLGEISSAPFNLPELDPHRKRLARKERRLREEAETYIRAEGSARLARKISALRKHLSKEPVAMRLVLAAVDRSFGKALDRSRLLPPLRPAAAHRLRIAFKTFRYQAEVAAPAARAFPEDLPRRLRDFQAALGEVQDADVLRTALIGFGGSRPLIRRAACRLTSALAAFDDIRSEIATFWRADPHAAFPWESPHGDI